MKNFLISSILLMFMALTVLADDNDSHKADFKAVLNTSYSEECGICHFAYFPGMLPGKSWKLLLSDLNLKNHFDEEIELNETTKNQILNYLINDSADKSGYKRSKKIIRSIRRDEIPLRISEIKYIRDKHRKIPLKLVTENTEVESFSNCDSCHLEAEKGIFDDDTVSIPGYGKWDDD